MDGVSIVIPTVGRPSLATLLAALGEAARSPVPVQILVVDDRPQPDAPLPVPPYAETLTGRGAGPAAARNAGWRAARHPWVVFLDDDVVPQPGWWPALIDDLDGPASIGGVQGAVRVPLPAGRRPTDWERVTASLAYGRWITADMAYRREALDRAGGFDERFPRAFREDAELAHRVTGAGWSLVRGRRAVVHPVRPEGPWISVRTQRGNADDALLRRMYGPRWRSILGVPAGRRRRHAAIVVAGLAAVGCAGVAAITPPRRRRPWLVVSTLAAAGWFAGTAEFAVARIGPGPRSPSEVAAMLATSAAIPPVALAHWLRAWSKARRARPLAPRN
jgi:hypothetical protein